MTSSFQKTRQHDFERKSKCQNVTLIILVAATDIIFTRFQEKKNEKIFLVAATKKVFRSSLFGHICMV